MSTRFHTSAGAVASIGCFQTVPACLSDLFRRVTLGRHPENYAPCFSTEQLTHGDMRVLDERLGYHHETGLPYLDELGKSSVD